MISLIVIHENNKNNEEMLVLNQLNFVYVLIYLCYYLLSYTLLINKNQKHF